MTPAEAAALLAIAAAFDNRKPDADAATVWALALQGLRFEDCREAIIRHFRTTSEWLMPAAVVAGVKRLRSDRIAAFGTLPCPQADPDDTAIYQARLRDIIRRIADGDLTDPSELALPAGEPRPAIEWAGMFHGVNEAVGDA